MWRAWRDSPNYQMVQEETVASSSIKLGRRKLLREEARDDGRHRGMGSILGEELATKTISFANSHNSCGAHTSAGESPPQM